MDYIDFLYEAQNQLNRARVSSEAEQIINNELYHYGVMGQRKGVRRWQNKDMSLTPEGRIHYGVGEPRNSNKAGSIYDPLKQQIYELEKAENKKIKKRVKDMSDDELREATSRLRMEKEYRDLKKNGRKSKARLALEDQVTRAVTDTIGNAIRSAGKYLIDEMVKTDYQEAKEAYETEKYKKDLDKLTKGKSVSDALRDDATDAANRSKRAKSDLEERAYNGDEKARDLLREVTRASKGQESNKKSNKENKIDEQERKAEQKQREAEQKRRDEEFKKHVDEFNNVAKEARDILSDLRTAADKVKQNQTSNNSQNQKKKKKKKNELMIRS